MNQDSRVIIVGGGVIGAFVAYYLAKKAFAVTLIEKDRFGSGASHGNCGLIVPDHILPLNSPGNLVKGLQWIFKKNAPLLIKPRLDPDLLNWLTLFAFNCRKKSIMISAHGRAGLLKGAIDLYRSVIQEEALECNWEILGALHAFRSQDEWKRYASINDSTMQFGTSGKMLNRNDALNIAPTLGDKIAGAWFYDQSAQLRPEALMKELKRLLVKKGVKIVEQTAVTGFHTKGGKVVAAATDKGVF